MISKLFFEGKYKNIDDTLVFTEEFVKFILSVKLYEKDFFENIDAVTILKDFYGEKEFKNNGVEAFLLRNFSLKTEENISLFNRYKLKELRYTVDRNDTYLQDASRIYNTLNQKDKFYHIGNETIESKLLGTLYGEDTEFVMKKLYAYYNFKRKYFLYYRNIDYKLLGIPKLFYNMEITELDITDKQLEELIYNNIYTLGELKKANIEYLISVFFEDVEKFINQISIYSKSEEEVFENLLNTFESLVKKEWKEIINSRITGDDNKLKTFEELGAEWGVTRQRIQQIVEKTERKLLEAYKTNEKILEIIYNTAADTDSMYVNIEKFKKVINNKQLEKYLLFLMSTGKVRFEYRTDYGIVWDKKYTSLEKIIEKETEEFKVIILLEETRDFNEIKQIALKTKYNLYNEKIYIKKGVVHSYIYMNIIEEYFSDGYKIGDEEDYIRLGEYVKNIYGDIEIPSMHSIQAFIGRHDFTQIDKGKYMPTKYCVRLPEGIYDEIYSFIMNGQALVTYATIYDTFKNKLEALGITNRWYLKGVLDKKLPSELKKNRDFIKVDETTDLTIYDILAENFRTFEAEFTIEDVKKKLAGLHDINYENIARNEYKNGLIKIATRTYVYVQKLNVSEATKVELKSFIERVFERTNSKIITVQKLYSNLKLLNQDLYEQLHIKEIYGIQAFFELIKFIYRDEYYFDKNVIALDEESLVPQDRLIEEYVRGMNKFDYEDVKAYIRKMNLPNMVSYLAFMEYLSDEYVQVGKGSMIRKEQLNLSESLLNEIRERLELMLARNEIKTNQFNGYFILPQLEIKWNKYLLVGIIRTYFNNEYSVINTESTYDDTEFIIRRN